MIEKSETIGKVASALVQAQSELEAVKRDRTATILMKSGREYSYNYADLATVIEACQPVLAANKLAVTQLVGNLETDNAPCGITVTSLLLHESGEYIGRTFGMTCDMSDPKGVGSLVTYLRRYGYQALIGVAAEDDTDAVHHQTQNGGPQPSAAPRSAPETGGDAPRGICPVHKLAFREVPAGVSKAGKPYNAFWACPERGCREHPAPREEATAPLPAPNPLTADMVTAITDALSAMRPTEAARKLLLGATAPKVGAPRPGGETVAAYLATLPPETLEKLFQALPDEAGSDAPGPWGEQ